MTALQKAIHDLEAQKRSVESAIRMLRSLGTGGSVRNISEEGRKRIAAAQRKRWAKVHASKKS